MSNLLKQALTKGKPPKPEEDPSKQNVFHQVEELTLLLEWLEKRESDDSDEEEKDTFE